MTVFRSFTTGNSILYFGGAQCTVSQERQYHIKSQGVTKPNTMYKQYITEIMYCVY